MSSILQTTDDQWCRDTAARLAVAEPEGLRQVLAFAGGDRGLAWRFAFTMAMIGFCPVEVASRVITIANLQGGREA